MTSEASDRETHRPRSTVLGGVALGLVMAGHQIAETARDALFLDRLGPTELPSVYFFLAALGVPLAFIRGGRRRPLVAATMFIFAPVTASFAWTVSLAPGALKVLYVWTGLSTTVIVAFFWRFLGDCYSVPRAKLAFPKIALGGIAGAALGAAGARGLVELFDTRWLLVAAGGATATAGLVSLGLERALFCASVRTTTSAAAPRPDDERASGRWEEILETFSSPYVRSVGWLLVAASLTFTCLDYTFKTAVVASFAPAELASVFATFYLALNVAAFAAQILIAHRVVNWVGLGTLVLFLPALILLGSAAIAIGGGVAAAFALKAFDGSLRHSLHRTSSELLFVPMSSTARAFTKPAYEIIAKRGGQAIASLLILALIPLSDSAYAFGVMTAVLAALWLACGVLVRRQYLGMFRRALRDRAAVPSDLPDLTMGSLRGLLEALNSQVDGEVVGAIDALESHGQLATVPDLILYHPSPMVLRRALGAFRTEGRRRVRPLAARLLEHEAPEVRSEALLSMAAFDDGKHIYAKLRDDPDPLVRGIASALAWRSHPEDADWAAALAPPSSLDEARRQLGVASAFAYLPEKVQDSLRADQMVNASPGAQMAIARALSGAPKVGQLDHFVQLLAVRRAREHARRAMVAIGDRALETLTRALADPATPLAVRLHLPRTISMFAPERAAPILLGCILDERDEVVRHKALRGLGAIMTRHPSLPLDESQLLDACTQEIERAFRLTAVRRILSPLEHAEHSDRDARRLHEALLALLDEGRRRGVERVFRLLHLLYPAMGLEAVFRGATSADDNERIGARELLTELVDMRLRTGVLALVPADPESDGLEEAAAWAPEGVVDVETAIAELRAGTGPLVDAAERYAEVLERSHAAQEVHA